MTSVAEAARPRYARRIQVLLVVAILWSLGVLAAALYLPVYDSSQTLVEVNGDGVMVVLALPLVASLVVAVALAVRGVPGLVVAWAAAGFVGLLAMLGLLTVGLALLPIAACLVAACAFAVS